MTCISNQIVLMICSNVKFNNFPGGDILGDCQARRWTKTLWLTRFLPLEGLDQLSRTAAWKQNILKWKVTMRYSQPQAIGQDVFTGYPSSQNHGSVENHLLNERKLSYWRDPFFTWNDYGRIKTSRWLISSNSLETQTTQTYLLVQVLTFPSKRFRSRHTPTTLAIWRV